MMAILMKHPMQPLETDEHGVVRFKRNAIVRYLLDHGGIDMNALSILGFSRDDRTQFAQLIGYSLSGFGDLQYVDNDTYDAATLKADQGLTDDQARIQHLETEIVAFREALREPMARLFGVHPDDLTREV